MSSRSKSGTKFEELHRKLKAQDEKVRLLKDRLNRTLEQWPGRRTEGTHGGHTHQHSRRAAEEDAVEPVRESTKMILELQDTIKGLSAQNVELKRSLHHSEHERERHQRRDEVDIPSKDEADAGEHKLRFETHYRRSRSRQSGADSAVALSGEEAIGSPDFSHSQSPPTAVSSYSALVSTRELLQTHEARASKYGLRQPTRPPTIPTPIATPCGDRTQSLAEFSINLTPTPGGRAFCEHLVDPND